MEYELSTQFPHLSAREIEVLKELLKGHNNQTIASTLYVAPSTIKAHRKSIYRKLRVHNIQEIFALLARDTTEITFTITIRNPDHVTFEKIFTRLSRSIFE